MREQKEMKRRECDMHALIAPIALAQMAQGNGTPEQNRIWQDSDDHMETKEKKVYSFHTQLPGLFQRKAVLHEGRHDRHILRTCTQT